jgi:hypothetical protein
MTKHNAQTARDGLILGRLESDKLVIVYLVQHELTNEKSK